MNKYFPNHFYQASRYNVLKNYEGLSLPKENYIFNLYPYLFIKKRNLFALYVAGGAGGGGRFPQLEKINSPCCSAHSPLAIGFYLVSSPLGSENSVLNILMLPLQYPKRNNNYLCI